MYESTIDLAERGFDAALAVRDQVPADMIAVRVTGPMRSAIVASPSYFERQAAPRTPDDLSSHHCIEHRTASNGEVFRWRFEQGGNKKRVAVSGSITVNDTEAAIRAALCGLGIAYTLDALVEPFLRSGQLVRVLEDWSPKWEGVYLYYQGRRQLPAALRAFIDMMKQPAGKERCSVKCPF